MNTGKASDHEGDLSLKNSALIAGFGLTIMAVLAPIANFSILQGLVVPDNAAETMGNIVDSEVQFRLGICFFIIVALLDVVVAWALYVFLRPVNRGLSLLTAWLRLVYATILGVAVIYLIQVLELLSGAAYLSVLEADQLQTQVMLSLESFRLGWDSGLVVFGLHLLLLGYLVYKAGYMRKVLGILIIIAGAGYMIDSFGKLLSAHYSMTVSIFTFIGEVILIFWLFIKGWKIEEAG